MIVLALSFSFSAVTAEQTSWRELTQFVADHIFRHENFHVDFSVVHHKRVTHKFGHDRAGAGPRLDRFFDTIGCLFLNLGKQSRVDKRTLFQ